MRSSWRSGRAAWHSKRVRILVVAAGCVLCAALGGRSGHAQVFKPRGKAPPPAKGSTASSGAAAPAPSPAPAAKAPPKKIVAAKKKAAPAKTRTTAVARHTHTRDDDADSVDDEAPRTKKKSGAVSVKHSSVKDEEATDDEDDFTITDD